MTVMDKVLIDPVTECHVWQGRRDDDGYGRVSHQGREWLAHRWAWTRKHGPIPGGKQVLHHCDNPPCINDAHLWLGTQQDNIADMVAKGRAARGSRNSLARLTEADIPVIRSRVMGGETISAVARSYAMSFHAIEYIVKRLHWRHVA